jgi:hypothetical protein
VPHGDIGVIHSGARCPVSFRFPEGGWDGVVLAKSDKPTLVFYSPSSPTLFSFFIL